ncbi:hypothetical protein Prum_035050 [Phytohabitans rumicis]|uniref:HTH marR-type domain-containing protein n=1 Tax=Phytohabitans rumicis TaxID=1076125 RepID=A0A6V8KXP3_9ACTN|nr:hypothetical protein Prum_035050 [Phytohabitans rumicis]
MSDRVAAVRAFNRFYTGVIGVLQEGLVHSPYTLTEARVLFELAQRDAAEVVELRRLLDLDAGYLSRILARFETDGMVRRSRSAADARRQVIELTEAGRAVQAELDQRSSAQVGELIGALGEADQRRLLGAMTTIEELLGGRPWGRINPGLGAKRLARIDPAARAEASRLAGSRRDLVVLRAPTPGDLGWIVQRHGAIYAREYGWGADFEAYVARIVADYAAGHDPRREAAWIAEVDGAPVGCVMCVRYDDATAQLRLLLVESSARGWAWAAGSWRSACGSPSGPATGGSCSTRTTRRSTPTAFTSGSDLPWTRRRRSRRTALTWWKRSGRGISSDGLAISRRLLPGVVRRLDAGVDGRQPGRCRLGSDQRRLQSTSPDSCGKTFETLASRYSP